MPNGVQARHPPERDRDSRTEIMTFLAAGGARDDGAARKIPTGLLETLFRREKKKVPAFHPHLTCLILFFFFEKVAFYVALYQFELEVEAILLPQLP